MEGEEVPILSSTEPEAYAIASAFIGSSNRDGQELPAIGSARLADSVLKLRRELHRVMMCILFVIMCILFVWFCADSIGSSLNGSTIFCGSSFPKYAR